MNRRMNHEVRLKNRPIGMPKKSDFEIAETAVPEPGEGEVLVRNIFLSVDPYMLGRMYERKSYVPPFALGKPLDGGCVGEVVQSGHEKFRTGDYVLGSKGWREYYVSDGSEIMKIDTSAVPAETYLGVMGMPGMTAYYGLLHIGQPREGQTVFVSAASGAVGSVVCQIAKIKGCRVLGSAGSDEKIRWLTEEAGIDAAVNYKKTDDLAAAVGSHCPGGIDIYFDNVGGAHLEAAIEHMNNNGRLVLCGMISQYAGQRSGPRNIFLAVSKRLLLQGFIIRDHQDIRGQFYKDMGKWITEGRIRWKDTVVEGIENAPAAFLGLFSGDNVGKMLVKV